MAEVTRELRQQCSLQESECVSLDSDQTKIKNEIEGATNRMEVLLLEKKRVEQRLEQLRSENGKLEEFLEVLLCYVVSVVEV